VPAPTIDELEAELAERRAHLSTTIDELVTRVSPAEIARREVEGLRLRVAAATRTPEGELRPEVVAGVLGAVSLVLVIAGLRRRYNG
jgi:hypothetical protein